ncbi:MAG: hypothetical protein K6A36_04870 [Paludibacteraceae bacterium]|nr:hypothetical protein [Paludibacteraceae bacterium]
MIEKIRKIVQCRWGMFGVVLLFNIAYFALMSVVLPLQYEENDDVMMCMIANGTYSGTPDYHLVYINVLYGRALVWLYGLTNSIEWYTLTFTILHILSMSIIVCSLLRTENRTRWEKALWLLALYVIWARIIVALQFTTTAGLTCLAGCILLLRGTPRAQWSGAALVIIAALIRFVAAGLVGLLMVPIILYRLGLQWRQWRKYVPIVVMLGLVVTCRMVNSQTYNADPEWRAYREYNLLRAQLNDNPNAYTREVQSHLPEGIDLIDYALLLRFIPDPEQIDLKAIRQLSATVGSVPFSKQILNVRRLMKYVVELSILSIILAMMILTTGNKRKYVFLLLYSLFVAILIVHVSLDGFLKNRVFLCMVLPILVTYYMLLPNTTGKRRKYALCAAMMMLSGWYVWQTAQTAESKDYVRYQWQRLQQPILKQYVPDSAYVVTLGTYMSMEAANPWRVWDYPFRKYVLGWMTWIPFNTTVASSYRGLLRDDMYIFTTVEYNRERTAIPRIREQIEKHYGVPTRVRPICHNGRYALIQLKVAEQPVANKNKNKRRSK